jgi:hypothetical protein
LVPLLLLLLLLLLQEFRRLDSSYGAARDRAQLLGGVETLPLLSVQVCVGGGGGQEEEALLLDQDPGGGRGACLLQGLQLVLPLQPAAHCLCVCQCLCSLRP